ncbi:cation efflux system protein [Thiosulfativibrio zosterae]|uniref:Cation efflux system protein n=2 Tax=Thiosulfativibrio zosterae TaxID=2675053 RepID=A0A6F8PR77_9GAMM|nr:CusA/CzcA family heavy metal efflux RND transporter [Thiosulfativibrio zosterae]BBP44586.1 cation efflux system protein [Thiosulfativibrio zosterae]
MITQVIHASIQHRFLVLLMSIMLGVWGWKSWQQIPLDAIPDLSDVQVIIKTPYPGQTPQVVEDQVTYPLTSLMMSVPKLKAVRGYSLMGDSYVYVLFEEGTDPYWARSRVLEYLNQVKGQLPANVQPALGPDASGVGWVYQYALVDKTQQHDLAQLRSLQDWFLKYELQAVPGVAEVAAVGGFVRQYQVVVDPNLLRGYGISLSQVQTALQQSAVSLGASVIEQGEAEYRVSVKGYVTQLSDLEAVPVGVISANKTPLLLKDIAQIQMGAELRRGVADLNGEGEVVGGIVVMRAGENALQVIESVKAKIAQIQPGLPSGVELVEVYNRAGLIQDSVATLTHKLWLEMLVVALVCWVFLLHFRSALVAIVSLPLGILGAFILLENLGVTANIMSLGGIAIAIGTMVDAAIVMIENAHKHLEAHHQQTGTMAQGAEHWRLIAKAASEVGLPLFLSLLIIALSFLPIFALQEQAGKLFSPLALTKTLAMAVAAGLAITLVPVLMGFFIRGKLPNEQHNPLNRFLQAGYRPLLTAVLNWPKTTGLLALLLMASVLYPGQKIGSEFMPKLDEGDLLYMPTTLPGISIGAATALLQQTDALIKTLPEVESVFGKVGRANSATDPAPLTMLETTIQLKDKSLWREGLTLADLIQELNQTVQVPGLANAWVQPIKTRIDMLSTGIKTPIGIKISGDDLADIEKLGQTVESLIKPLAGVRSVFSDRAASARYIDITPNRAEAARYGLSVGQINQIIASAVGGQVMATTLEGRERISMQVRYPQVWRDSVEQLRLLPIVSDMGVQLQLGQVADIEIRLGAPMIQSENARLNAWVLVDLHEGVDLLKFVENAQAVLADKLDLPKGMSVDWAGQYVSFQKAQQTLTELVPLVLMLIVILLYFIFKNFGDVLLVLGVLPFALLGSVWVLWGLGFDYSIAVGVGMIALLGVAAEFGVVMLMYLNQALTEAKQAGQLNTRQDCQRAVMQGAVLRLRPKTMTVSVIVLGLLPIFITGYTTNTTGLEMMQHIAAPLLGGMLSAPLVSMLLIPLITYVRYGRHLPAEVR